MNYLASLSRKNVSYKSRAPYPHSLLGYDSAGFRFAPRIKNALIEASLIDMLCPSTIPQLKRLATAPEVPVRVVIGMDVYDADYNSSSLIAKGRRCVSR